MRGIFLTFDDGPSQWTEPLLDVLAERGSHATFFVLGEALNYAGRVCAIERMAAEGHTVGVHGWTHTPWTRLPGEVLLSELAAATDRILFLTGKQPTLCRAPHHMRDAATDAVCAGLGLNYVGQTLDPGDWFRNAEEIVAAYKTAEHDGAIVNLHDGYPPDGGGEKCTTDRQPTVDAVRTILASGAQSYAL